MSRKLFLVAVPAALTLAACGGAQEIPVTNTGNVVLNDAQANYAFTNDNETTPAMREEMNMAEGNMTMADNAAMPGGNMM